MRPAFLDKQGPPDPTLPFIVVAALAAVSITFGVVRHVAWIVSDRMG